MLLHSEKYLILHLAPYTFALPMSSVTSIERVDRLTPSTDESGAVGTLERGSRSWPVFLLGQRVQARELRVAANSQVVLVTHHDREFGILVDSVSMSDRLTSESIRPVPFGFGPWERYLYTGTVRYGDDAIMVLSIAALANDEPDEATPATPQMPTAVPSDQILIFDRGTHEANARREYGLGIASGAVREVAEIGHMTPLPPNPSWIVGLTILREQSIAVIDLGMKTGLRSSPETVRKVVLVSYPGGTLAFQAGAKAGLISRTNRSIVSRRAYVSQLDSVTSVFDLDDVTVAIPELLYS